MKQINFNKEMKERLQQYENSTAFCLRDVYGSFSYAKQKAFEYCEIIRKDYENNSDNVSVNDGKILTASKFVFTYGFTYTDSEYQKHFVLITPSKNLDAIVEE